MSFQQTASQTVGPYFIIGFQNGVHTDNAGDQAGAVTIHGRVFDGKGTPVTDGVLEFWQADANGHYADASDAGFLRVPLDADGNFTLRTVKPGRVAGPNGTLQAPHLVVNVFMRGLLKHAPTRVYFDDEAANGEDPILALVPVTRRATLIAKPSTDGSYVWDLHMQGADETVFFSY
ncbi:protocatechuate 3,4-dioxygenase subunit alpha [Solimonas marina]|uniref:Protocatechuate 3,4-dioxygenase subunit alpha n=1 Tax=Solimonas marina TaxID=2714601 RepID=A0A970B9V8_9GAMM|nr:protocatechuate 3,4-dioxygenase subunit alpha [Solimonas marina]NKF23754.1 protocatechuate 3,4-dioxygenase subunit alpha [Solimonas marina]